MQSKSIGEQVPKLVVEFVKMHGAGNDFVLIDNRFYAFSGAELGQIAARLCQRRFGIGADGLLAFESPRQDGLDFSMVYLNADGSVGEMCGNGARCIVSYARSVEMDTDTGVTFESDGKVYRGSTNGDLVRVQFPQWTDYRPGIPIKGATWVHVNTGVPHAVTFVEDLASVDVMGTGAEVRYSEAFSPAGSNVDFVKVVADDRLRVRTYERGVENETLACGTGAMASAAVAVSEGRASGDTIRVEMPGGELTVGLAKDPETGQAQLDYLAGPAAMVFRGNFEFPFDD